MEALQRVDILCAPVADYQTLAGHPQLAANGMVISLDHPIHGAIRAIGFPIDSATSNARSHSVAPEKGQDSAGILTEAGFSSDEIAALLDEKIVRLDQ